MPNQNPPSKIFSPVVPDAAMREFIAKISLTPEEVKQILARKPDGS